MAADIIQTDALDWATSGHANSGVVVTSVPEPDNGLVGDADSDADNGGGMHSPSDPWTFFDNCVRASFHVTDPHHPIVFIQTDRRSDGTLSKAYRILRIAEQYQSANYRLLWHKIALTKPVGSTDIHRPTYRHVLAFGTENVGPGSRTPDVFTDGHRIYDNATGMQTSEKTIRFAMRDVPEGAGGIPLIDPFCGRGTIPVMADALGYQAIGVEIDPEQVDAARSLALTPPQST